MIDNGTPNYNKFDKTIKDYLKIMDKIKQIENLRRPNNFCRSDFFICVACDTFFYKKEDLDDHIKNTKHNFWTYWGEKDMNENNMCEKNEVKQKYCYDNNFCCETAEVKEKTKRDPIIHRIKCDEPFFTEINEYIKTFELRLNDRDYRKNDFLIIERSQKVGSTKTMIYAHVTYILEGYPGLQPGYCIMGIDKLKEHEENED